MAKAERPHIPQRVDELTPEWFTRILDAAGQVVQVSVSDIGEDVGFMGRVLRCRLTWSPVGAGPASVVVKVPTSDRGNFALGQTMQVYEREIDVYRNLGPDGGLPMPACLHAEMDPDPAPWLETPILWLFDRLPLKGINLVLGGAFALATAAEPRRHVLVLEDIVGARPPMQQAGGTVEDTRAALTLLAQFHARHWMRDDLTSISSKVWPIDRASRAYQANYERNRESFIDRFRAHLDDATIARLDAIQERVPELNAHLTSAPWTLLHGDYRLDNLLFVPTADGPDRIVVIDQQAFSIGRAAFDVAYFITTALEPEHRAAEPELLGAWHEELIRAGVHDYRFETLVEDCRVSKEILAHRIVGAADILNTEVSGDTDALVDIMQIRLLEWLD